MVTQERYMTAMEAKDLFATKADLANMETRIIKWMIGMMFGTAGIAASAVLIVQNVLV